MPLQNRNSKRISISIQDFKAQVAGQMAIKDITSRFSATNGH
jgi:hypothetical protein